MDKKTPSSGQLVLTAIRFEDGIVRPWLTTGLASAAGKLIEMPTADVTEVGPYTAFLRNTQQEFESIFQTSEDCFQNLLKETECLLEPRRLSIPVHQLARPVPITPHTKKTRRTRPQNKNGSSIASREEQTDSCNADSKETKTTRTRPMRAAARKKSTSTGSRRVATRSSKALASQFGLLSEIQEEAAIVKETVAPLKAPRKNQKTVTIVPEGKHLTLQDSTNSVQEISEALTLLEITPIDNDGCKPTDPTNVGSQDLQTQSGMDENQGSLSQEMGANNHGFSNHEIGVNCHKLTQEVTVDDNSSATQENSGEKEHNTPNDVRHLISLHDTLIKKQSEQAARSLKNDTSEVYAELNASPTFSTVVADVGSGASRSMEERIQSCVKKNPVVKLTKWKAENCLLQPMTESPQPGPITLNFEASDEEDIADSVAVDEIEGGRKFAEKKEESGVEKNLPRTPLGTCSDTILPPRRSLALQLRLSFAGSDPGDPAATSGEKLGASHDSNPLQPLEGDATDSLEDAERREKHSASGDASATISDASTSVCSSSAATVILENISPQAPESQSSSLETELRSPLVRRSVRTRKNAPGDSSCEEVGVVSKARPKIVKPVRKPAKATSQKENNKPTAIASNENSAIPRNVKRNLEEVENVGLQSPVQPKTKYMRCGSPLCLAKPKMKPSAQKSRNTFLNRSTAASRARRTPGRMSPAMRSRSRVALIAGSPFNFDKSQTVCLTPLRLSNLTVGVQSFIHRNSPAKVNYEEQLAAKKEQLEEKRKREREAKRRKEEEEKRKILEKKRKRSERLRKAALLREKVEKEKEEKQLKIVEQWEKRVADADKVKVLRKKEETAKSRKLEKKQAEAEEIRRKEEESKIKKLREQEQERERRLLEQKAQKEQEAAARKQAEIEKQLDKQRQEKLKEEAEAEEARKRMEEERKKREEEEKAKRKKAEEANKLKQQKLEKEEVEKRRKIQEEIEKRNAEAVRIEQERVEKEKEAQRKQREEVQRKQEEAIRRREREEARKKKLEEAKAAAEEKARKRRQEEVAKAEESRRKREEIRREAERRREEERLAEKERQEEEKRKRREEAEKLRKIQESNAKLKKLEEEHRREREVLRSMGHDSSVNKTLLRTPASNLTFTHDPNASRTRSPQSYDITPRVPKPDLSTEENYSIEDLSSGDTTDDDEQPRKPVPRWAKGGPLKNSLTKQYYNPPNIQDLFSGALDPGGCMRLDEIFKSIKMRYFKRTSSACWNSPVMPVDHISFTEQCRGFDQSMSEKV